MKIVDKTSTKTFSVNLFSITSRDVPGYKFAFIKSGNRAEDISYSLVCIPTDKSKDIIAFRDFARYSEGWSQGTNRSVKGYYLVTPTGTASNGSGKSSPSTPSEYDLKYDWDDIAKYLKGSDPSDYKQDWYHSHAVHYPPKTLLSEIKSSLTS